VTKEGVFLFMKNNIDLTGLNIGVVGAGSWGTALANLLGNKGFRVDLWVFEKQVRDDIETCGENKVFLPGVMLSSNIFPTGDIKQVVSGKDIILIVVPSHVMREVAKNLSAYVSKDMIIISASKGIENNTYLTMTGVLRETLPMISENNFAVLSGPSFAKEVADNVPTLVGVASKNKKVADFLQHVFATPAFRVYTIDDIIGVELGGAVKNVIAIAAGISVGLKLGLNTRAALITRGLTEIRRLGLKLGANPRTFTGLSCLGDLLLTCTGELSRNHTVGKQLGEGKKLEDILHEMQMVAEGIKTAKSVYNLSSKLNVEMPISHEVYHILYEDISPQIALARLMSRELKQELDEL
jgi:glycerol-3-phosphate dehydrogenase (NAD(P)+)